MPSFRLNFANIQGCPAPAKVAKLMEQFGLPKSEEFGVLACQATEAMLFGTIVRRSNRTVARLDAETKEITAAPIEMVTVYPFGIRPFTGRLETYAGSSAGIEQVSVFLCSCLALPSLVGDIEIDVPSAIDKLAQSAKRFQLRAVRVSEHAHNAYMIGAYAPKFLDSEHGKEFLKPPPPRVRPYARAQSNFLSVYQFLSVLSVSSAITPSGATLNHHFFIFIASTHLFFRPAK